MGINGHAVPCERIHALVHESALAIESIRGELESAREEWAEFGPLAGEVLRAREEIGRLIAASDRANEVALSAKDTASRLYGLVEELRADVTRVREWRDESKVQEITELRRALEDRVRAEVLADSLAAEREAKQELTVEVRRAGGEKSKLRYQLLQGVVVAVIGAMSVFAGRECGLHSQQPATTTQPH